MRYCLLSGRLFMSVIAVLLFVAVTSYGNNLGKAPIQFNKDKICNKSKTMERDTIKLHIGSKVFVAVLENNSSAMALKELLADEPPQSFPQSYCGKSDTLRTPCVTVRGGQHFQCFKYFIEVIKRLAHPHHHYVGQFVAFRQ